MQLNRVCASCLSGECQSLVQVAPFGMSLTWWWTSACVCLQVRSISLNVRKNVSLNTLSQGVLLKEFSTISWDANRHTRTRPPSSCSLQMDIHRASVRAWTQAHSLTRTHTHAHQQGRSSSCPPVNGTWETETDALMWWCLLMCVCLIIEVPAPCWFLLCSIDWTVSRCVNFWIEWSIFYSRCSSNISATDVLSSFCSLDSWFLSSNYFRRLKLQAKCCVLFFLTASVTVTF